MKRFLPCCARPSYRSKIRTLRAIGESTSSAWLGAAYHDLTSNGRTQGASTLTMQLAKNLFLSSQQTFGRKLQEIFLSIQIEHAFTKEQIFTLYANQIYLGQGVYGFEAGSEYYFSKHARDLTLPEAALLAALPKSPTAYSPIANPDHAFRRRNMVINSMLEDGVITNAQANAAKAAPLGLHIEPPSNSVAPWFVEDVRRELERQFGSEQVHEEGLRVYTTLDLDLQQAANSRCARWISRTGTPPWMEGQPAQCASRPAGRWTISVTRTGVSQPRRDRTCMPW